MDAVLTSNVWRTWDWIGVPTWYAKNGYSHVDNDPFKPWGSTVAQCYQDPLHFIRAPYKNYYFLCVPGYQKGWAVLDQVTFNITSHTETEGYDCAELMTEAKKRGTSKSQWAQGEMKTLPQGEK